MAITSYCKKCRQDVPRGDSCPYCGAKLTKSSARVVWCLEHSPVKDWMCWNAVLRIMAPAMVVLLGMILLLEGLAGGWTAVEALVNRGLLWTWGTLCLAMLAGLWLILLGQGRDLLDCVVDHKGVHITTYLMEPTALRLMLRLRSPALAHQAVTGPAGTVLMVQTREIAWKEISRVQLWPEKATVLLYAPNWWMRLAVPCSAFQYEDVLEFMRDKVGRRKDLLLPEDVKAAPKPRKPRGTGKVTEAVEPAPSAPLNEQETEAMRALLEEMHQAAPEAENVGDSPSKDVTNM